MYHRIIPVKEVEPGLQAGMYVEPETFKMHIDYLKDHFSIVPLSAISTHIKDINEMKNKLPICILTFDDGWYDFYRFAYPILVVNRVPATVFLPTEYIGTGNRFWTDQVANFFVQKRTLKEPKNHEGISNSSVVKNLADLEGTPESNIEKAISILKKYREDEILKILEKLKTIWGIDSVSTERAFLNWDEVRKMAESGLITFGSHTANHRILVYLNEKEIVDELIDSKNKLLSEGVVDPSFIPFCYPNGNYDESVVWMVKEAGYHVAVTTERGWNDLNSSFFKLKRVAIHQDISSTKELLGCRTANIF